jgi:hypothetical protein
MMKSHDGILWQDYRASNTGMVVFYASDPVSEIPVREIAEDIDSPVVPEPNYETGTYGFYGCSRTKIRGAFAKSKIRYLFFLTKYAGTKDGYKDKMLVTGYFRIAKTADVQKLHLRYLSEYSCIDAPTCIALRADEVHFVGLQDAFEVSPDQLKTWGFNAKVSKQLRIILSVEQTSQLLEFLKSKPDQLDVYAAETKRLSPYDEEVVAEEDEESTVLLQGTEQSPESQAPAETPIDAPQQAENQAAVSAPSQPGEVTEPPAEITTEIPRQLPDESPLPQEDTQGDAVAPPPQQEGSGQTPVA